MVLKPSEKTPLSALFLADLLYDAGLPPEMFQVVTGDPREIADELITNEHADLVTFTGGVAVGKYIASKAGLPPPGARARRQRPDHRDGGRRPRRGLDPRAQGSYKNSGQRCTAVKRMLVHEQVAKRFVDLLVAKTEAWKYGDPMDRAMDMGTVIDEAAATQFEGRVNEAVAQGARLLAGNKREGALYSPTVIDNVDPGDDGRAPGDLSGPCRP
jgi:acyl-CoA reductase-like NAD-dependent aldehyde dehydrogenase